MLGAEEGQQQQQRVLVAQLCCEVHGGAARPVPLICVCPHSVWQSWKSSGGNGQEHQSHCVTLPKRVACFISIQCTVRGAWGGGPLCPSGSVSEPILYGRNGKRVKRGRSFSSIVKPLVQRKFVQSHDRVLGACGCGLPCPSDLSLRPFCQGEGSGREHSNFLYSLTSVPGT